VGSDKVQKDNSTEEKILQAARVVFTQKGYAATRTRDIAEAAGINLALLNYYFRSKENLFSLVMAEKMQKMLGVIVGVLNNTDTTLIEKVSMAVEKYFLLLQENPDLPIFVLSEIQKNPEVLRERIQVSKLVKESHFAQQLMERRADINPQQMIMNLLGMVVFPFVIKPLLLGTGPIADKAFAALLEERRRLVPLWFEACLKA
jgi:AcrR family transcriptional regulator